MDVCSMVRIGLLGSFEARGWGASTSARRAVTLHAQLAASDQIDAAHLAEAIQYGPRRQV
jgi:hypothetical protein